jgi:hypothetical protein
MRTFSPHATPEVRDLLQRLADRVPPPEYREAMRELGGKLADVLALSLNASAPLLLICTNEDADFLARGVVDGLSARRFTAVALACFWNDRQRIPSDVAPSLDVAPIIRRYVEPVGSVEAFVVVKSVISSACVVRTNITEMYYELTPKRVIVTAPVMYAGAAAGLEGEFPADVAATFEYVWFAQDDEKKSDGEVVPGIGGSVYELLGVGTKDTKNLYTPDLVRQRRKALYTSP